MPRQLQACFEKVKKSLQNYDKPNTKFVYLKSCVCIPAASVQTRKINCLTKIPVKFMGFKKKAKRHLARVLTILSSTLATPCGKIEASLISSFRHRFRSVKFALFPSHLASLFVTKWAASKPLARPPRLRRRSMIRHILIDDIIFRFYSIRPALKLHSFQFELHKFRFLFSRFSRSFQSIHR